MEPTNILPLLDDLDEKAKATSVTPWSEDGYRFYNDNGESFAEFKHDDLAEAPGNAAYMVALVNAYPQISSELRRALKVIDQVKRLDILFTNQAFDLTRMVGVKTLTINGNDFNEAWRKERDRILKDNGF